LRRRIALAAVVAAAGAALAGGCGSSHVEDASQGQGEQLFADGCAQCHTLAAAGAQGQIGPNLDAHFAELREQGFDESSMRDLVRAQIAHPVEEPPTGAPGMPADIYEGEQADAVAAYVAAVAGGPEGDGGGGTGDLLTEATDGETIFLQAGCGSCHALAAAGASGTIGPNLDESKPDVSLVVDRVTNGMGGMPSFEGRLSDEQIQAVADYVSTSAGG
jgi:cbb3-type cytochrome c oxidase subunit III